MDNNLRKYATDVQWEAYCLYDEVGTYSKAASILGKDRGNVRRSIKAIHRNAAKRGYSPDHQMIHSVPEGFIAKGISTYYNQDGEVTGQWVKSASDRQRQVEILIERLEEGSSNFTPFMPTEINHETDDNLLSLLTITDFHLGMYSWADETGDDWDVGIARDVFLNSIADMIAACPKSKVGILNQLGDFLHFDSLSAVTPASGHLLDADTRYGKLVDLSMEVMTEAVKILLNRFERVIVVQAEGNHDMAGSVWLRKHIKHMFVNEPRVEVMDVEFPYYAMLWGEIMLAVDGEEMFNCTAHLFFEKVDTPYPFLLEGPRNFNDVMRLNRPLISDILAFIHLWRFEMKEPARMKAALAHLEDMQLHAKSMWKYYLAETDDKNEWIPNPKQTGVMQIKVTQEMLDTWLAVLDETGLVLQGKKLIPFWRGKPGKQGVNLRRVFTEPRIIDPFLWVQGTAAAPYLEEGPITDFASPEMLGRINGTFGGGPNFFSMAFWFN